MNWYWYCIEGHRRPPPGSVKTPCGKLSADALDGVAARDARPPGRAGVRHGVAQDEAEGRLADHGGAATAPAGS